MNDKKIKISQLEPVYDSDGVFVAGYRVVNGAKVSCRTPLPGFGAKGDTGEQGAQGIQGAKGDTGEQGAQGIQGAKGDTGLQGAQGIQGAKGDTGEQGIQGAKGDTGAKGDQGIQGVKGDTGEQGPQGTNGRGIVSSVLTSSIGLVDTYTTTYTDGTTDTYTVTNGGDGSGSIASLNIDGGNASSNYNTIPELNGGNA